MTAAVLIQGKASRALPTRKPDGTEEHCRSNQYQELFVNSAFRKQHILADEGAYFIANNAQTGIATPAVASFGATTPFIVISNNDSVGNSDSKRMYLDYINLVTTAAGSWASAGVNLQMMLYLDNGDRYTSGGTDLTSSIICPNMDFAARSQIAKVRCGNITAAAASGAVRCVSGLRILRPAVSATVADVVGETKQLNFGGVEAMYNGSITVANANSISIPLPPVIIGPAQCCLIYFVMNGTTPSAASYAPEIAWWER